MNLSMLCKWFAFCYAVEIAFGPPPPNSTIVRSLTYLDTQISSGSVTTTTRLYQLLEYPSTPSRRLDQVSHRTRHPLINRMDPILDYSLSVDPPGIAAPIARSPYPNAGGIVSFLLSPMHMSRRPSSHL